MTKIPVRNSDVEKRETNQGKVRVWRIGHEDDVRIMDASEFRRGFRIDWDSERHEAHRRRNAAKIK